MVPKFRQHAVPSATVTGPESGPGDVFRSPVSGQRSHGAPQKTEPPTHTMDFFNPDIRQSRKSTINRARAAANASAYNRTARICNARPYRALAWIVISVLGSCGVWAGSVVALTKGRFSGPVRMGAHSVWSSADPGVARVYVCGSRSVSLDLHNVASKMFELCGFRSISCWEGGESAPNNCYVRRRYWNCPDPGIYSIENFHPSGSCP